MCVKILCDSCSILRLPDRKLGLEAMRSTWDGLQDGGKDLGVKGEITPPPRELSPH